jgi:transposase
MLTESGLTFSRCIAALGKSDLRRGVDGLAAQVRLQYNLDPLEKDTLFLFCGTRHDRLKGLLWTGDRFILLYIRLAEGRFQWPRTAEEARQISGEQFQRLMEGFSIDSSIGPKQSTVLPEGKKKR